MQPPMLPINILEYAVLMPSSFNMPNGVAEVMPSGVIHLVIKAGNDATKNALPTKAGLNILWPRPPNINFPMPIATILPSNGIHKGTVGGSIKANSKPVRTAEPSITNSFFVNLQVIYSVATAPIVAVSIINSALTLKK